MEYGPQTPMNTTTVATAVQRRWACHTRAVLPADAYGRQRCNVVLSAWPVVYLWYMSWAVCSSEGNNNRQKIAVTSVQNRPHIEKPGKSSYPLPPETTLRVCHASYTSARIELKPPPRDPDGLPVSTYVAFWVKVLAQKEI